MVLVVYMLKLLTRQNAKFLRSYAFFVNNKELFDAGYLAKLKYYPVPGFDRKQIALNSTGADFNQQSLKLYARKINLGEKILNIVKRLYAVNRKNILVFTSFVEEAEQLVPSLDNAAIVTAQTRAKERERIINDFRNGKIKTVANVGILTTGFDYPEPNTIVIARPTRSLALYYQMAGRGIRPHPNKKETWIVDLGQNVSFFGKLEDFQIHDGGNGKWFVSNGRRQLTNVYFDK